MRHTLRNLLRPWGPCPYYLPPRNRSPCTPPDRQANPSLTPSLDLPLGPVSLPPTPPEPKPLHPPPSPCPASLTPRPPSHPQPCPASQPFPDPFPGIKALGLPPLHQASSGGYPPRHPTGHPSKTAIFLLFVRVRNDKNTTHVAKFAPSLGPVSLPPTPPEPKPLHPPPEPLPPPVHQASSGEYPPSLALPLPPTPRNRSPWTPPPRALAPPSDFFYHLVPQTPPRFEKIVKRRRPPSLTSYLTEI